MSRRVHTQLPAMNRGYQLEPCGDWISIVVPEATTNICTNPSLETNTTGWSAFGTASIARSTEEQRFGAYSLKVTPTGAANEGASYLATFAANTTYTASIYFKCAQVNVTYRFSFVTFIGATGINQFNFVPTGKWQRLVISLTNIFSAQYYIRVRNTSTGTTVPFYLDGLQIEAKPYATTYCDGDQRGFVPTRNDYYWTGAPHASTSSRIAQCRAGGREMKLSMFGFRLLSIIGLGMAPAINVSLPSGFLGGSAYQRSVYDQRLFSLIGDMRSDAIGLCQDQANLIDALKHDITTPPQPLLLRYQMLHWTDDRAVSEEAYIRCLHDPLGPGNTYDNLYQESTELRFRQDRIPTIESVGEVGASLDYQDSVTTGYFLQRSPSGVWSGLSGGANGEIYDMARDSSGNLYVVGAFTTIGGVAANRIAIISPTGTVSAIGSGANAAINSVAISATGRVYITGAFTTIGGVAANRIAYYESGAWNAMGSGLNADGYKIRVDVGSSSQTTVVVGNFTTANGVSVNYIARWTGATFAAYSTGLNAAANDLVFRIDGSIVVVGDFTDVSGGGTPLSYVGQWDGSAWSALGSGFNASGTAITIAPNGDIYTSGTYTSPSAGLSRWNGTQWFAIGDGFTSTAPAQFAYDLVFDQTGVLWVGGYIRYDSVYPPLGTGGASFYALYGSSGIFRWNGSSYIPIDISIATIYPSVTAIDIGPDGTVTIVGRTRPIGGGGGFSGTSTAAGLTSVYNPGDSNSYPTIEINGPATLYSIRNITTGKEITFFNLYLDSNERAKLILDPSNIKFYSNLRPNLEQYINRGSQEAEFYLAGRDNTNTTGLNIIAVLALDTGLNTDVFIHFRPRYQALQSLIYR